MQAARIWSSRADFFCTKHYQATIEVPDLVLGKGDLPGQQVVGRAFALDSIPATRQVDITREIDAVLGRFPERCGIVDGKADQVTGNFNRKR